MRVLLVEDRSDQIEALMGNFGPEVDFVVAEDRESAWTAIEGDTFDLAICDLKIPSGPDSIPDVEHGLAVLTRFRETNPGTPVFAFTAYSTKPVLALMLSEQRREDYLGTLDDQPMLAVFEKDDLLELVNRVIELADEFASLEGVEIAPGVGNPALDGSVERVLKIYGRQRGCVLVRSTALEGGLSGVPVMRVELERADGSSGGSAVVRIGDVRTVEEERRRFQQRVSGLFPLGSYAEIVGWVRAGAANTGGVFYQVADGSQPMYRLLADQSDLAVDAVHRMREIQEGLIGGAPAETWSLERIRRVLISDSRWQQVYERCGLTELGDLEAAEILIRRGTLHGDLHGRNVLIADDPVLIDFVSVTDGPTPMDAVSLELSLLFHPDAPDLGADWPTEDQMEHWADIGAYVLGCPMEQFVRACRAWALAVARADRDVYACAYAHVASQSRFDTSSETRLAALMRGLVPLLA